MGFFDFFKGKNKDGADVDKEMPAENNEDSGVGEQEEQVQSSEDASGGSEEQSNQ